MGAVKEAAMEAHDNRQEALGLLYGDCIGCTNPVDCDWEGLEDQYKLDLSSMSDLDIVLFKEEHEVPIEHHMCTWCQHKMDKDD